MPARTVVFTALRKWDGIQNRLMSSGEYIQVWVGCALDWHNCNVECGVHPAVDEACLIVAYTWW
eukprot:scaffold131070_cov22-Tisochrysis_lutea.AAC.1